MIGEVRGGEDQPVLAGLGPVTWSPEDGVAYEVALEVIHQVVGAYSALIAREESAVAPDESLIGTWEQEQGRWAGRGRNLSPADSRGVDHVTAECQALLARLRAMR